MKWIATPIDTDNKPSWPAGFLSVCAHELSELCGSRLLSRKHKRGTSNYQCTLASGGLSAWKSPPDSFLFPYFFLFLPSDAYHSFSVSFRLIWKVSFYTHTGLGNPLMDSHLEGHGRPHRMVLIVDWSEELLFMRCVVVFFSYQINHNTFVLFCSSWLDLRDSILDLPTHKLI